MDATNLSERHHEYLYRTAERLDVKLILERVETLPELVRGRLERWLENSESRPDADWAVYQRMKSTAEKIQRKHYAVDTSRDITAVLDKIAKEVSR